MNPAERRTSWEHLRAAYERDRGAIVEDALVIAFMFYLLMYRSEKTWWGFTQSALVAVLIWAVFFLRIRGLEERARFAEEQRDRALIHINELEAQP